MMCVLKGMAPVSDGGESPLLSVTGVPSSAYRRPDYPLVGCSPAEPTSVSPGKSAIPNGR